MDEIVLVGVQQSEMDKTTQQMIPTEGQQKEMAEVVLDDGSQSEVKKTEEAKKEEEQRKTKEAKKNGQEIGKAGEDEQGKTAANKDGTRGRQRLYPAARRRGGERGENRWAVGAGHFSEVGGGNFPVRRKSQAASERTATENFPGRRNSQSENVRTSRKDYAQAAGSGTNFYPR